MEPVASQALAERFAAEDTVSWRYPRTAFDPLPEGRPAGEPSGVKALIVFL